MAPGHIRWEKDGVRLIPTPSFLAKNQSASSKPVELFIKPLTDFSPDDKVWCPVRALKWYLDRTKTSFSGFEGLFVPLDSQSHQSRRSGSYRPGCDPSCTRHSGHQHLMGLVQWRVIGRNHEGGLLAIQEFVHGVLSTRRPGGGDILFPGGSVLCLTVVWSAYLLDAAWERPGPPFCVGLAQVRKSGRTVFINVDHKNQNWFYYLRDKDRPSAFCAHPPTPTPSRPMAAYVLLRLR